MGIVCSRPISDFLEDGFLKLAMMIDYIVRMANKYIAECISFCIGGFVPRHSRFSRSNPFNRLCIPDNHGVCFYPVTNAQRRQDEKRKRSERRKRAEAAALGLNINRKRRGPFARGYDQVADLDPEEQAHIDASLGQPARAPPARPAAERETAAERDRGKLWVMANVQPSYEKHTSQSKTTTPHLIKCSIPDGKHTTKHTDHPGRRSSEGAHIRFDIISSSSSSDSLTQTNALRPRPSFEIGETVAKRVAGQRNQANTLTAMREVQPRTTSKPSSLPYVASGQESCTTYERSGSTAMDVNAHTETEVTSQAVARPPAMLDSGAKNVKKPSSSAVTDVSVQKKLMLSAAPLESAFENAAPHKSKPKPELGRQKTRNSIEVRSPPIAQDHLVDPALVQNQVISKDTISTNGSGLPLKRLFKVNSGTIHSRTSLDGSVNGVQLQTGGTFSDTASIAGSDCYAASISASSPMAMADLADRACLSAKDAPRKERRVWKDEVEKIAIQRVLQQDAARRGQASPPFGRPLLRRTDTNDSRMNSPVASSPAIHVPGSGSNASISIRAHSPPVKRRRSLDQANRRRSTDQANRRKSLSPITQSIVR